MFQIKMTGIKRIADTQIALKQIDEIKKIFVDTPGTVFKLNISMKETTPSIFTVNLQNDVALAQEKDLYIVEKADKSMANIPKGDSSQHKPAKTPIFFDSAGESEIPAEENQKAHDPEEVAIDEDDEADHGAQDDGDDEDEGKEITNQKEKKVKKIIALLESNLHEIPKYGSLEKYITEMKRRVNTIDTRTANTVKKKTQSQNSDDSISDGLTKRQGSAVSNEATMKSNKKIKDVPKMRSEKSNKNKRTVAKTN